MYEKEDVIQNILYIRTAIIGFFFLNNFFRPVTHKQLQMFFDMFINVIYLLLHIYIFVFY